MRQLAKVEPCPIRLLPSTSRRATARPTSNRTSSLVIWPWPDRGRGVRDLAYGVRDVAAHRGAVEIILSRKLPSARRFPSRASSLADMRSIPPVRWITSNWPGSTL